MNIKKNALIVTSIDGLATLECGIASIVHWFFEAMDEIVKYTPRLNKPDWELYALSPEIDMRSSDYSKITHDIVRSTCKKYGGDFLWFPVENSSSLSSVWSLGDYHKWELMCESLSHKVRDFCKKYDRVTLLVHGVMLTGIRKYLMDVLNVQVIFMAHSLGRVFEDRHSLARTEFEDQGFSAMEQFPQDKIGYVGSYFKGILEHKYHRKPAQLAPFVYSIHKDSFRFPVSAGSVDDICQALLDKYNIPGGKRLIFSWGRCTAQKGFDVIISGFGKFVRQMSNDWHLVLLMPQEVSPPDYIMELDGLLRQLPSGSFTAITDFDELLPYYILKNPKLEMAIFASRFESGPLTLMEAIFFGHEKLKIVWHDIPPMKHLLASQPVNFPFSPLQSEAIVSAMMEAERYSGISITKETISSYSLNISDGLKSILSWW